MAALSVAAFGIGVWILSALLLPDPRPGVEVERGTGLVISAALPFVGLGALLAMATAVIIGQGRRGSD